MPQIQRPSGRDASTNNASGILYVRGNEFANGSIRFIFTTGESTARIESRSDGVWNDTGFRFSSGSINLGRDLQLEAAGSFLETFNDSLADNHKRSLVPHIRFTTADGTTQPHTPVLNKQIDTPIFTTAVSEIVASTIGISFANTAARFISKITHQNGATTGTAPVTYSVYIGTDNTGILIARQNLPTVKFVAESTLIIEFPSDIGINRTSNIFLELVGTANFSLKTDASAKPLTTLENQPQDILDLVTDNLAFDNDLNLAVNNDLTLIYANHF